MPPAGAAAHAGGMSISPASSRDSVHRIEADFAQAMTQLYAVGNDLSRLRRTLEASAQAAPARPVAPTQQVASGHAQAQTQPHPAQRPAQGAAAATTPPPRGHVTPPPVPPPPSPPAAADTGPWWRSISVAAVLAAVGAGITLIGVAFLVALAIQMGIFGPLARVLSGAALATVLVFAGVLVKRRQHSVVGAIGLVATGLAAGYLDIIAVTRVYEWVPAPAGLAVAGLVAGVGLLLARSWDSQLLATITVVGVAALAPAVGAPDIVLVGAFLTVLTAVSWPAQIGHRWHVLEIARVVPTSLFVTLVVLVDDPAERGEAVLALLVLATVLVTSVLGARHRGLSPQVGALVAVASVPALFAGAVEPRWTAVALLVVVAAAHLLAAGLSPQPEEIHLRLVEVSVTVAGFATLLAALRAGDGGRATGTLVAATALVWALTALVIRHRAVAATAGWLTVVALAAGAVVLPRLIVRGLAEGAHAGHVAQLALLTLALAAMTVVSRRVEALHEVVPPVLAGLGVLASGGVVIAAGIVLGDLTGARQTGFTSGHAAATVLWLAVAAALLVRGARAGSGPLAPAGLALATFCVGKLVLFDLSFLSGLPRVAGFILGGVILLAMGAGFAQALERGREQSPAAPVDNSTATSPNPPTV